MTDDIRIKLLKRVDKIIAHYALQDFKVANPKRKYDKQGLPIIKPYSLSGNTVEAQDIKNLLLDENILPNDEFRAKNYITVHADIWKEQGND